MKWTLFTIVPVFAAILMMGCSKDDDTTNNTNATPVGTWAGAGQYGTTAGNPTYPFSITFKTNGTVDITGNNSTAADIATGTWQIVADSVRVAYRYASSSADYTLAGKFTAGATVMAGTIGLGTTTTGVGIFSVTKQ